MNRLDFIKTVGLGVASLATIDTFGKNASSEDSFYNFYKWSFAKLNPTETFSDAPYIKYVCDIVQESVDRLIANEDKVKDLIFAMPPRSGITGIFSIALPAYIHKRKAQLNIIRNSYSNILLKTSNEGLIKLLEHDIEKPIGNSSYTSINDRYVVDVATRNNICGYASNIQIYDSPNNPIDSIKNSRMENESVHDWFEKSIYNRLTPIQKGLRIIASPRYHKDDLIGHLLKTQPDKFEYVALPLLTTKSTEKINHLYSCNKDSKWQKCIDPNRFNKKTIADIWYRVYNKEDAGYTFDAMYHQKV